jgi:hypothetical protein
MAISAHHMAGAGKDDTTQTDFSKPLTRRLFAARKPGKTR